MYYMTVLIRQRRHEATFTQADKSLRLGFDTVTKQHLMDMHKKEQRC